MSSLGTIAVVVWLLHATLNSHGADRRRRLALAIGCITGAFGGGGVIAARVWGHVDVIVAAPFLLASVALAAYAVLSSEVGRSRQIVAQGIAYAVVTATLSSVGLTAVYRLLP